MMSFFQLVVESADINKMNKRNLSIVFAPNMLSAQGDNFSTQGLDATYEVFTTMIDNYYMIFASIEEERRVAKEKYLKEQEEEHRKERQAQEELAAAMKEGASMSNSAATTNVDRIGTKLNDDQRLLLSAHLIYNAVRQGWLSKKGAQRRNWNTRWFVLRYKSLGYYKVPFMKHKL